MTGMTFTGSMPLYKELSEMMQELEAARSKLLHLRDHENTKVRLSRINRYLAVLSKAHAYLSSSGQGCACKGLNQSLRELYRADAQITHAIGVYRFVGPEEPLTAGAYVDLNQVLNNCAL